MGDVPLLANRFLVLAHKGRTQLGEEFKVQDTKAGDTDGRMEQILLSGLDGADAQALLRREVEICQKLDDGFVRAHAWGFLDDERAFVFRESTDGLTLLDLRGGALKDRVERLLGATYRVAEMAAAGMVHRNLGPLTVWQGEGEVVKLSGLSLARADGVAEVLVDPRGAPFSWLPCAAPEALRSFGDADERADVYSLGVLLYALLAGGAYPYPGPMLSDLLAQQEAVRNGAPAPDPGRSHPVLSVLCRAAIELDPDKRLATVDVFATGLEAWLGRQHSASKAPTPRGGSVLPLRHRGGAVGTGLDRGDLAGGRFKVTARLKQTRAGDALLAVDNETGEPCLVEQVLLSGSHGENCEALVDREVLIGKTLRQPEFLQAIEWGRLGPERLFVVREQIEGLRPIDLRSGSVRDRGGRLMEAARRVQAVAAAGGVHRDIGPLTVLQDDANDVYLAGFGLAKVDGVQEPPLDLRGPAFSWLPCVAPELLINPDEADGRADVYSLGVLLFASLTGSYPYPGTNLTELVEQHAAVRSGAQKAPRIQEIDSTLPIELDVLCTAAIALDPAERLPSAAALADALWSTIGASGILDPEVMLAASDGVLEPHDSAVAEIKAASALAVREGASPYLATHSEQIHLDTLRGSPDAQVVRKRKALCIDCGASAVVEADASVRTVACEQCSGIMSVLPGWVEEAEVANGALSVSRAVKAAAAVKATAATRRLEAAKEARRRAEAAKRVVEAAGRAREEEEAKTAEEEAKKAEEEAQKAEEEAQRAEEEAREAEEEVKKSATARAAAVPLSEFQCICLDCGKTSYVLPPMTAKTSQCTFCGTGALRSLKEASSDDLSASDSGIINLRTADVVASLGGESGVWDLSEARAPATSEMSVADCRVVCVDCGKFDLLLPPATVESSGCRFCGGALAKPLTAPAEPEEELTGAVATDEPLAPSPEPKLTTLERRRRRITKREGSGTDIGSVSWGSSRPQGRRIGRRTSRRATTQSRGLSRKVKREVALKWKPAEKPKPPHLVVRGFRQVVGTIKALGALGILKVIVIVGLLAVGFSRVEKSVGEEPLPSAPVDHVAPPAPVARSPFEGEYLLRINNADFLDPAPDVAWCYLSITTSHDGKFAARAWRDDATIECKHVGGTQAGGLELVLEWTYPGKLGEVSDLWRLKGRLGARGRSTPPVPEGHKLGATLIRGREQLSQEDLDPDDEVTKPARFECWLLTHTPASSPEPDDED